MLVNIRGTTESSANKSWHELLLFYACIKKVLFLQILITKHTTQTNFLKPFQGQRINPDAFLNFE